MVGLFLYDESLAVQYLRYCNLSRQKFKNLFLEKKIIIEKVQPKFPRPQAPNLFDKK